MSEYVFTIGRRKTSVVGLRLYGVAGKSTLNAHPLEKYYASKVENVRINKPFNVAELNPADFYFTAKSVGGGKVSQMEALVLAISRAIIKKFPETKKALKDAGLLTRDSRMVERKKPGLRKARKAEQYSKR